MPPEHIHSADDPRLIPFRELPARDRLIRDKQHFIAEGEIVVRRLLESDFQIASLLAIAPAAERLSTLVPSHVPVYVASEPVICQTVGYRFHLGVVARAWRKSPAPVDEVIDWARPVVTIVAASAVAKPDNVGAIIRAAAAFKASAVLLDQRCADPFSRRVLRVSMGNGFKLPVVQSDDLASDLHRLQAAFHCSVAATLLDHTATPLPQFSRANRQVLLLGSEGEGLPQNLIRLCDRKIIIPMTAGVDSLNVAMAAGIILYHLSLAAPPST